MVAPLTLYTKTVKDGLNVYSFQRGYKQPPPHTVVSAYERHVSSRRCIGTPLSDAELAGAIYWGNLDYNQGEALVSDCYEKFKSKISDRAQMGTGLIELNQSVAMISNRVVPLARSLRYLRKGDLSSAAKALGLDGVPSGVKPHKSIANNWLELHFGWVPTVLDIQSAVNVLQSPVNNIYPKVSSRGPQEKIVFAPEVKYVNPGIGWCGSQYQTLHTFNHFLGQRSVYMGAEVRVDNPNLWLANQLGFVSLPGIIWEAIPFSFVADWFGNIGQFLSQGSDFYGLTLDKAFTSKKLVGTRFHKDHSSCTYWGPGYKIFETNQYQTTTVTDFVRSTGISKPGLFVRPFKVWGWQRAATAVSLLTQLLK